jgi:ABC-type transport system involved in cytochrome bd biosynthesis fused ATPase/permease subunit
MRRPAVELAAAVATMLAGAWLIGWWAVGIVLILLGALLAVDAVLRDDDRPSKQQLSDEVLERYRRAR